MIRLVSGGRLLKQIPRAAIAGAVGLIIAILAASAALIQRPGAPRMVGRQPPHAASTSGRMTVALPPPDLFRPLTPEEAVVENAKRAPAPRPDSPAAAFSANGADEDNRARALECLSQAIYYEAASEPVEGQRAVAQIVLNRVRHPAYPATVCGVVYQGSERTTGCQFSFTCDGSLRRTPVNGLWQRARKLAKDALAGKVFGPVGHATYYHADYVVPYWADSLDKEIQIGRHIFYRLRGGLGTKQAFAQRYRGQEPSPLTSTDIAVVEDAFAPPTATPPEDSVFGPLAAPAAGPIHRNNPVLADLSHGELLADEGRGSLLPPLAGRQAPVEDTGQPCPSTSAAIATKIKANDNRIGGESGRGCR